MGKKKATSCKIQQVAIHLIFNFLRFEGEEPSTYLE